MSTNCSEASEDNVVEGSRWVDVVQVGIGTLGSVVHGLLHVTDLANVLGGLSSNALGAVAHTLLRPTRSVGIPLEHLHSRSQRQYPMPSCHDGLADRCYILLQSASLQL